MERQENEISKCNTQLKELVEFCRRYDDPFTVDFESEELRKAIGELKQRLEALPDLYYEMETTLKFPTHGDVPYGNYPSHYAVRIPEIYYLLKTKGYYVFFHEITEFFEYEILVGDMDNTETALSYPVKTALIGLINKAEDNGLM